MLIETLALSEEASEWVLETLASLICKGLYASNQPKEDMHLRVSLYRDAKMWMDKADDDVSERFYLAIVIRLMTRYRHGLYKPGMSLHRIDADVY